jgi:L-ribulose-5-phosphate 3-epimerase UlaE|tara:strand:- start:8 stop:793 length:786 start_codon:yes stop_codon:yes gene_type:complete
MIGITLGRLSRTSNKKNIQIIPKNIEKEFFLAKKIGYDYIELHSDENKKCSLNLDENKCKNIQLFKKKYNIKTPTFTLAYIISNSLTSENVFLYLKNQISFFKELDVKNIILPLFNKSNYKQTNLYFQKLKKIILFIQKNNMNAVIESNCNHEEFRSIQKLSSKKIFFCFDIGNRISVTKNLQDDLKKFEKEMLILHIKNKNKFNKSVKLSKGLIDINNLLRKKNFKKVLLTFENIREYPLYQKNLSILTSYKKIIFDKAK